MNWIEFPHPHLWRLFQILVSAPQQPATLGGSHCMFYDSIGPCVFDKKTVWFTRFDALIRMLVNRKWVSVWESGVVIGWPMAWMVGLTSRSRSKEVWMWVIIHLSSASICFLKQKAYKKWNKKNQNNETDLLVFIFCQFSYSYFRYFEESG